MRRLGTRIVTLRSRSFAAGVTVVASQELPWPSVIEFVVCMGGAVNEANLTWAFEILVARDNDTSGGTATTGTRVGVYKLNAASPPSVTNDQDEALLLGVVSRDLRFPCWIPVPGPEHFLKTVMNVRTVPFPSLHVMAVLSLVDTLDLPADGEIDVRVPPGGAPGGVPGGVAPGAGGGPAPPPAGAPPLPPPPPVGLVDPLSLPLPLPTAVDPTRPVDSVLAAGAVAAAELEG